MLVGGKATAGGSKIAELVQKYEAAKASGNAQAIADAETAVEAELSKR